MYIDFVILILSFFAGSKGRMVHLLKEKSKVQWKQKDRKKYKPLKVDLGLVPQEPVDFSAEMKKLDTMGATEYLSKSKPIPQTTMPSTQETDQIDSLKKRK